MIIPIIRWHLICFTGEDSAALVFTSPSGMPLRHTNFRHRVCLPAIRDAKVPAIHFHDLRHTGNTLAARAGASLRELTERMGHDSERAALIYLHGSSERQHQIADGLSQLAREELKRGSRRSGTEPETGLVMTTDRTRETGLHLRRKERAPGASRTRDLLPRRHTGPSAAHTSKDARRRRAKQPQAVVLKSILN